MADLKKLLRLKQYSDLINLAKQYRSDVETRISILREQQTEAWEESHDEYYDEDYEQQIAHWEATLKQINEVLGEN